MGQTSTLKPIGPIQAVSVTNVASAPITVAAFTDNERVNFAAFQNSGATDVIAQFGKVGKCPTPVFPVPATPGGVPLGAVFLHANMVLPLIVETPEGPFDVIFFGAAAGPSFKY